MWVISAVKALFKSYNVAVLRIGNTAQDFHPRWHGICDRIVAPLGAPCRQRGRQGVRGAAALINQLLERNTK